MLRLYYFEMEKVQLELNHHYLENRLYQINSKLQHFHLLELKMTYNLFQFFIQSRIYSKNYNKKIIYDIDEL